MSMTAKERQLMLRLQLENEQLRAQHKKHFDVYRDALIEIVELRTTIQLVRESITGRENETRNA